jgi:hypothetical protein
LEIEKKLEERKSKSKNISDEIEKDLYIRYDMDPKIWK